MDFISHLPETILHNILYRLSPREATQTCVLSKAWNRIESQTPFLRFYESCFPFPGHTLSFAEKRVNHFSANNLSIVSFCFHFSLGCFYDHRVTSLLKRVIHNGQTQLLDLNIRNYTLPPFVLQSDKLTALSLCSCKCDARAEIRLPKLTSLQLSYVEVDSHFVEEVVRGCPSLLRLKINYCSKITTLAITCLERIQRVDAIECRNLSNVAILSPNLHCFRYVGYLREKPCDLIISPTKKLILESVAIQSSWLHHQISTCEKLTLNNIDCVNDIYISSQKMRKLSIYNCKNMKNIARIDCPNLQSLVYVNNQLPFCSPCEFALLCDIRIEFYIEPHLNSVWYIQLKDLFQKFGSIKELIKQIVSHKRREDLIILDGFKEFMIPELFDIKDLKRKEKVIVSSILKSRELDELVKHICKSLKCLKRIFHVASTHCRNNSFSQVLFDKLSRIRAEANCCQNARVKCWRHRLYNISKDSTTNIVPTASRRQQFDQCQITAIMFEFSPPDPDLQHHPAASWPSIAKFEMEIE